MEIEIKLAPVPGETGRRIIESEPIYIGESSVIEMNASYYDTPSRALKKQGVSLRLRRENDVSVCCLKMRVSDIARQEFEVRAGSIAEGIAALCALDGISDDIKTLITTAPLECLYSSRYLRLCRLASSNGSLIEVAYDKGELYRGELSCAVSEVELELKEGETAELEALCAYLQAKYRLTRSNSTKAGRASALTEENFGVLAVSDPAASVEDTYQAYLMGALWKKQSAEGVEYRKSGKY